MFVCILYLYSVCVRVWVGGGAQGSMIFLCPFCVTLSVIFVGGTGHFMGHMPPSPTPPPLPCYAPAASEHNLFLFNAMIILPYSDKRKQLLKVTFLVNEQNLFVMIVHWHYRCNIIILWLQYLSGVWVSLLPKIGVEVERANCNLKTSLSHSQIWVICHLLPSVRVGQYNISSLLLGVALLRSDAHDYTWHKPEHL